MAEIRFDEISFLELTTFLSVAQTGSMSLSSAALHISQPAVSKRIASLEKKFGLILFVRTNTGLRLTPAGKTLYQELVESLDHLKSGFDRARSVQADPGRTICFGYDGFFDLYILHKIFNQFTAKHPNVRFETKYPTESALEDCSPLFSGKADIMLCPDRYASGVESYVKQAPVTAFQFYILVSKEHPLAKKDNVSPGDLIGVPLIVPHNSENSPYLQTIRSIFVPYGFSPRAEHLSTRESLCFDIVERKGVSIATPGFWNRMNIRASQFFSEEILAFPIDGAEFPMSLFWRNNADALLDEFAACFSAAVSEKENAAILEEIYSGRAST